LADHANNASPLAQERFELAQPNGVDNSRGPHGSPLSRPESACLPHPIQLGSLLLSNDPASQVQEDIVQTRLLDLNGLDAFFEVDREARHELGAAGHLKVKLPINLLDAHSIVGGNVFGQLPVTHHDNLIAANHPFK
jgi:hypothetical protein